MSTARPTEAEACMADQGQPEPRPSCRTCVFWSGWRLHDYSDGECHRHAPSARAKAGYTNTLEPVWPPTPATAWCGDHVLSPEPTSVYAAARAQTGNR